MSFHFTTKCLLFSGLENYLDWWLCIFPVRQLSWYEVNNSYMEVTQQEQLPGRSEAVVATAGVVRRGWQMLFSYHSIRQHALQQNSKPSWFFRISEISMKHVMQDDGICHNLHCPRKMRVDRATHLGACHVPRAGHRGSLAEIILWYVHQLQMLHKRFVKIK